jgi:putative peptidoglycan lipid II flippase
MTDSPPRPPRTLYLVLVALAGGTALLGFFREAAIARYFGATRISDAFYAALVLPFVAAQFLVGGAFAPPLTVDLAHLLERGEVARARALVGRAAVRLLAGALLALLLLSLFAERVARFVAPGFDPAASSLTARLLPVLGIYGLLTALALLFAAPLLAAGNYRRPLASFFAGNLVSIGVLVLLAPRFGVSAAAWGLVAGGAAQLAANFAGLVSLGLLPRPVGKPDGDPPPLPWSQIGLLAAALAAAGGIDVAERAFSSGGAAGGVAILALAGKVVQLPMRLFAAPLASVAYPRFARIRSRGPGGATTEAGETASVVTVVLLWCAAVTVTASGPAIAVAFGRGRFDADAVATLARALAILAPAVVAVGLVELATKYLAAARATLFVAVAQIAGLGVYLASAPFLRPLGTGGLAAARDLAWCVAAGTMVVLLGRREPGIVSLPRPLLTVCATVAAVAASAAVVRIGPASAFPKLLLAALAAGLVHFGLLFLSRGIGRGDAEER